MINRYQAIRERGIMGMNRRNVYYIGGYNDRKLYPLVDDKLKTKKLAIEHGVSVPNLIAVIDRQYDVKKLAMILQGVTSFCVKPAKGSGGKGILVITKSEGGNYFRANGQALSLSDLQRHVSNILAGLFSLGGATDVAMFETCIQIESKQANFTFEGVPDIRIIVFRGIPVMGMMRLSCKDSQGKANLHQGAIGVGIHLATGQAVNAIQFDHSILVHPDTQQDLMSLQLSQWNELLKLACACADMTGLGYLGVDLVVDRNEGPLLLELNARPGLSIQLANNKGLLPRLDTVEALKDSERWSIQQRVDFAQHQLAP